MRNTPTAVLATVLALVALALTACSGGVPAPGRSSIEVDTPKLAAMKADAGVEECEPGTAESGSGDLPPLALACLGGGADVDLSTLRGPLVINIWTSTCEPCRQEMPALQEFHETYGDRVPVIGIDATDTYPEAALALVEETGARYPQLADPGGELYEQDDVRIPPAFPQFVLVDADGRVVHQEAGGLDSVEDVERMVTTELGVDL
ncbi:MAG: hypothetical protein CMH83_11050 [Nocardioides sp.]|nr:hypothetical protein [Nocardioides sp.]